MAPSTRTSLRSNKRSSLKPPALIIECRNIVQRYRGYRQYHETMRSFGLASSEKVPALSDEESAERMLGELRAVGVDEWLLDDGATEDTPPVSAHDRVQRALMAVEVRARNVVEHGPKRITKGSSVDRAARNQRVIEILEASKRWQHWRTMKVGLSDANDMLVYLRETQYWRAELDAHFRFHNAEALQQMLNRAKRAAFTR